MKLPVKKKHILFIFYTFIAIAFASFVVAYVSELYDSLTYKKSKTTSSCTFTWQDKLNAEEQIRNLDNELLNTRAHCASANLDIYKEDYTKDIVNSGWHTFSSGRLGLSFDFLVEGNSKLYVQYQSYPDSDTDPRGSELSFSIKSNDQEYGGQAIAVANSLNLLFGRDEIEPNVAKWKQENGKYYIVHGKNSNKTEVLSLGVWKTNFGTEALLYNTDGCLVGFGDTPERLCADRTRRLIVNIPSDYSGDFDGIQFIIPNYFTIDDILRIVNSINLMDTH